MPSLQRASVFCFCFLFLFFSFFLVGGRWGFLVVRHEKVPAERVARTETRLPGPAQVGDAVHHGHRLRQERHGAAQLSLLGHDRQHRRHGHAQGQPTFLLLLFGLPSFTEFFSLPPPPWTRIWLNLVLPSFTWFDWVFLGFTGFYRVLLGFTGFYLVLPSFT